MIVLCCTSIQKMHSLISYLRNNLVLNASLSLVFSSEPDLNSTTNHRHIIYHNLLLILRRLTEQVSYQCIISPNIRGLHVFPRFSRVTCFSELFTSHMLPGAFHRLSTVHVFPPFPRVTCFPALSMGFHVFPRLPPIVSSC